MTEPRCMTFAAWRRENLDLEEQIEAEIGNELTCEFCDGEGEKECDQCGHESECDECEGTGKAPYSEATKLRRIHDAMYTAYEAQKAADLKKWQAWQEVLVA